MKGTISKALLLSCLVLLAPVACSGDAEETGGGQSSPAPAGEDDERTRARKMPRDGPLASGRYSTRGRFEPSLSLRLGPGWRVPGPSGPRALNLGYITPGQEVAQGKGVRFRVVREIFDPRKRSGRVLFEAKPVPKNVVGWLQKHPYLETEEPAPVDVGGVTGQGFDARVEAPEEYGGVRGNGCTVPCVPLFRSAGGTPTRVTERGGDRFVVLEDVAGGTVVIIISASTGNFDGFVPKAEEVLETAEWEDA